MITGSNPFVLLVPLPKARPASFAFASWPPGPYPPRCGESPHVVPPGAQGGKGGMQRKGWSRHVSTCSIFRMCHGKVAWSCCCFFCGHPIILRNVRENEANEPRLMTILHIFFGSMERSMGHIPLTDLNPLPWDDPCDEHRQRRPRRWTARPGRKKWKRHENDQNCHVFF